MPKRPILYDIKIATGIAILLVVIGHLASRGQEGIDIYVKIKALIYKFHMPLFLFLSGYISAYTYKEITTFSEYKMHVRKKFIRLFPAYLLLSLIFFLGKYLLGSGTSLLNGVKSILLHPSSGNSGFLWYIYVLFLYNLILPLLMKAVKSYFWIFFILSVSVSFITFPDLFSLNFFFWYLPFFIAGCFSSIRMEKYRIYLSKIGIPALVMFLVWAVLEYMNLIDVPKTLIGFIAILGIHYVSLYSIKRNKAFELLGDHSFNIYLFNTLFIGGMAYFLNKYLEGGLYNNTFYYFIPLLIFAGIFFSIVLYRFVKKVVPLLAKYIH